jgi:hypothetical protein
MSKNKRKYTGKTTAEKLEIITLVDKERCKTKTAEVYRITALHTANLLKKLGFY